MAPLNIARERTLVIIAVERDPDCINDLCVLRTPGNSKLL